MGHHLGVGLAFEDVALGHQFGLQLGEILDDAVMDQHNPARLVRMGIGGGRSPVGGPAGVTDADRGSQRLCQQDRLQFPDLALGPTALNAPVHQHRNASGIIAPVLQPLQAVDQTGNRRARPGHADDAAHGKCPRKIWIPALCARTGNGLSRPWLSGTGLGDGRPGLHLKCGFARFLRRTTQGRRRFGRETLFRYGRHSWPRQHPSDDAGSGPAGRSCGRSPVHVR